MFERATLIMPMRNEAAFLPETLASIEAQTIDRSRLRLYAIDGDSDDGSADIVRAWLAKTGIAGSVLPNPQRRIPAALNIGARAAEDGEALVRLDAHTTYGPTYVADVLAAFERFGPTTGCVGCAQVPAPAHDFERAVVGELLTHPLGLARLGVRDLRAPVEVETVYLGSWPPGLLQRLGGFDERWRANEDSELEARLRDAGYTLVMVPSTNRYHVNRGIFATIRQWGAYGFWRAQTTRRFPHELRARHAIPIVLLIGALWLLFTPWRWIDAALALAYVAAVLALHDRRLPLAVGLGCAVTFPLFQIAWTIGLIRGLFVRPPAFVPAITAAPTT